MTDDGVSTKRPDKYPDKNQPDQRQKQAALELGLHIRTEHACSSDGIPVLVDDAGGVLEGDRAERAWAEIRHRVRGGRYADDRD